MKFDSSVKIISTTYESTIVLDKIKEMIRAIFIFLLLPTLAFSQQIKISGKITNNKKQGLANVNVFLEGTYDGTFTDSIGNYTFTTYESGTQVLKASLIGYNTQTATLLLQKDTLLDIVLTSEERAIDEVVVNVGQFRVGALSKSVMSPLDIVTTAGSMGNIVAALEKLPGAQIAGENGRLMVRGGSPNETQTYVNGIRVAQPYTSSTGSNAVRGRFSPYLFKGTNFSTGGYGAEYGNALSSILNLTTVQELEMPKTEISISNMVLGLSNTQTWGNKSLSVNGSYTNLLPYQKIIKPEVEWTKPYEQFSGEGILRVKGDKYFSNTYVSYAYENLGIKDYEISFDRIIETNVKNNNIYANSTLAYYLPHNWKWESGIGAAYSTKNTNYADYFIPTEEQHAHVKTKFSKPISSRLQLYTGTEYFYDKMDEKFQEHNNQPFEYGYNSNIFAAYLETNWKLTSKLYLNTGLRYTDNFEENRFIEPRATLAYQFSRNSQGSFAYGQFHQAATDDILKYNTVQPWQKASHYIANYSYQSRGKNLRLEGFWKQYDDLATYNTTSPAYNSQYNSDGYGAVKGLDIFWKDENSIKNLQYWVSYSYTDAKKLEQNYPTEAEPSYVAKHYLSIVAKYWISKWRSQVGLTNTFTSGRPYHNPNLNDFMQSMTKSRNELSANWSYLLTQQKILHISFSNLLGQTPIYNYKYALGQNGQYREQGIKPIAKHTLFVGFFWTMSKNKQDNQLDNL